VRERSKRTGGRGDGYGGGVERKEKEGMRCGETGRKKSRIRQLLLLAR